MTTFSSGLTSTCVRVSRGTHSMRYNPQWHRCHRQSERIRCLNIVGQARMRLSNIARSSQRCSNERSASDVPGTATMLQCWSHTSKADLRAGVGVAAQHLIARRRFAFRCYVDVSTLGGTNAVGGDSALAGTAEARRLHAGVGVTQPVGHLWRRVGDLRKEAARASGRGSTN